MFLGVYLRGNTVRVDRLAPVGNQNLSAEPSSWFHKEDKAATRPPLQHTNPSVSAERSGGKRWEGSARVVIIMGLERAKTFGDALVRARQAAGLTQSQLGSAVGIPQSTISVWERGEVEPPNDAVFDIERALSLKPGSLSALLGVVPVIQEHVSSVEAAIIAEPRLDEYKRRLLLQIFESMLRG